MTKQMMTSAMLLVATMPLIAETETIDGYRWSYSFRIRGTLHYAEIRGSSGSGVRVAAVSPKPTGAVTIPATLGGRPVMSIGDYAFYDCGGITDVTIPGDVMEIGKNAFSGCSELTGVAIPDCVANIGENAFLYCNEALYDTASIPGVKLVDGWAVDCERTFSGPLELVGVRGVGEAAFRHCQGITSLTVPGSVTVIGAQAFSDCGGLRSVTMVPARGMRIGAGAFSLCSSLGAVGISDLAAWCEAEFAGTVAPSLYMTNLVKELIVPDGVGKISDNAFSGFRDITKVVLPNSVTNIGKSAFSRCSGITEVTLSENVTSIGSSAFSGCSGLTEIAIPASVTSLGNYAFEYCIGLTAVHISDLAAWCRIAFGEFDANPLYYAHRLYLNGSLVTDLVIPDGITSVERSAFRGCSELTGVTIPDSVTRIGERAFEGCSRLADVTIPDSVTSIGGCAFYRCTSLTDITIPPGVTSISGYMFEGCSRLADVTIPDSVTRIGERAFCGCSGLKWLVLPEGLGNIGSSAFANCSSLQSVYVLGEVPATGDDIYNGTPTTLTTYVPDGATGWLFPGSTALPDKWPVGQYSARNIENGAPSFVTVEFDANGGSVSPASRTVLDGTAVGALPTPIRDGYDFAGWWTAASGGVQVTAEAVLRSNVTYYAHWTAAGGGAAAPTYAGKLDVSFSAAQTLPIALYNGEKLAGTVEVKVGRINGSKRTVKISATATLIIDGKTKRFTAKAVSPRLADEGTLSDKLVFKAPIGEMAFTMNADGTFTLDNASYVAKSERAGGGLADDRHGTFRLDSSFDLAVPGDRLDFLLPTNVTFDVANGRWKFAKGATVKWARDRVTKEYGLVVDDTKDKTNRSSLKLTYAPKTGIFKGTFKVYALEGPAGKKKLKKYTVNVIGFVVGGTGFGEASCKKPSGGPWAVTVE